MKYLYDTLLLTLVTILCLTGPAQSELVTESEAQQIANNWITQIVYYTSEWNKQTSAKVTAIEPFQSDGRLLGYYCTVSPSGFIIVSAVKGLAPVKIYSPTSTLDIDATEGPTALFKFQMERLIREVELQIGRVDEITPQEVEQALVYKQTANLERLIKPPDEFLLEISRDANKQDYLEEESLLSSHWHQGYPYDWYCPDASADCSRDNCNVGCVATAAAQIMRYWSWPPQRDFAWGIMPDYANDSSTVDSRRAVADLCYKIGASVGMDWCSDKCASSAATADMETVYEEWRYDDCTVVYRDGTPRDTWWQEAKARISVNQPIQYRILGHSIVLDGWREWVHGSYIPEYHMNYGWDDDADAWYKVDQLLQVVDGGSWEDEYMIINIVPAPSLHSTVSGPQYNFSGYRYVNRDCYAHAADFYPGQYIQFLPRVSLVCTELMMKFTGLEGENTYLYTIEPDRGIRIRNGAMKFYPGCGIRFDRSRPGP